MANAGHTKSTLDGLMKDEYSSEKLESLTPEFAILKKLIKFDSANKLGRDFVKSVSLTREHGFSYGDSITTALANIISSNVDDAKVRGSSMTLRAGWSYGAAAAMASDKGAFINATAHKFMTMMESAAFRLETQMIHGSKGFLVTDASNDGDGITAKQTDGTTFQVKIAINPLYYSDALVSGLENALISLYEVDSGTASAITPTGGTLNQFSVVGVDLEKKALIVECGLEAVADALVLELEDEAYDVYFAGAKNNEMVGLRSIVANTGSLYGINAANYSAWKGNSKTVSGNLTLKAILQGVGKAVGRGFAGKALCLVNPQTFATMANDEAALRQYTAKTTTGDRGVSKIEYVGSNGLIEVVSHPLMWESQAIAFPADKASRIGTSDLTFNRPGFNGEMIFDMPTYGGVEARLFSDQALFLPAPGHSVIFTAVSNS